MTSRLAARTAVFPLVVLLAIFAGACHKKQPPVARPLPPPPPAPTVESKPPAPPTPIPEAPAQPTERVAEDSIGSKSLDELNRNSPLKPVFYALDSSTSTRPGRRRSRRTPTS
jgi:hypothetical protein